MQSFDELFREHLRLRAEFINLYAVLCGKIRSFDASNKAAYQTLVECAIRPCGCAADDAPYISLRETTGARRLPEHETLGLSRTEQLDNPVYLQAERAVPLIPAEPVTNSF